MAYVRKRTGRIAASPHEIALGFSFGVLLSFTPFMGAHILAAAALAWLFGASMIASALGTLVGNPITFPFIWACSLGTGNYLLGRSVELSHATNAEDRVLTVMERGLELTKIWEPLIKPMLVGGLPMGIVAAIAFYFPIRKFVSVVQAKRREMLLARSAKIAVNAAAAE
jgi:hypothetical protein